MSMHSREIQAEKLAREQLPIWRAWGADPQRRAAYEHMAKLLPPSTAASSFELARALLADHRALAPKETPRPHLEQVATDEEREAYFAHGGAMKAWAPGSALALRDALWGWSPETIALRERSFEASDPALATNLARAMAELPEAPWRRWACASPIAAALLRGLDAAGQREPAIARHGAASLPALMGFAGMPFAAWGRAVAEASTPDGFAAESCMPWGMNFIQGMLARRPEIAPRLPTVQGFGEDYSRASDVTRIGEAAPLLILHLEALGFQEIGTPEERPAPMEPLRAAQASPFAQSCMSAKASGLPLDFDRQWPMARAMGRLRTDERDPIAAMAAAGGSMLDTFEGQPIWEGAAEPTSETGSEGYYAPIDDHLMEQIFASGADLRRTGLARRWAAYARKPEWDKDCSLTDFYELVLDPPRAAQANQVAAKWQALCERVDIDAASAPGKAAPKPRAL